MENVFEQLEQSAVKLDEALQSLIQLLSTPQGRFAVMMLLTPAAKKQDLN